MDSIKIDRLVGRNIEGAGAVDICCKDVHIMRALGQGAA